MREWVAIIEAVRWVHVIRPKRSGGGNELAFLAENEVLARTWQATGSDVDFYEVVR